MQLHKAVFFKWGSAEPKLPVVSKGSTGLPVFSTKKLNCVRHLRPLDVFSRLLVGTKSICGQGSALNPTGGAYSAPPDSITSSVSNQNCCKGFRFTEKVEKCRHKIYMQSVSIQELIQCELCVPVASIRPRSSLRSAAHGILFVPRTRLEFGKHAFTVAGQAT